MSPTKRPGWGINGYFGTEDPFSDSHQQIYASRQTSPWRSVQQHEVSATTPWSETARLCHTFLLAPVRLKDDGREYLMSPAPSNRNQMNGMCILVWPERGEPWMDAGLLGWSGYWKSSTNRTDVLDVSTINLESRQGSLIGINSVDRFEQRTDGKNPHRFSAWFGKDKEDALQEVRRGWTTPALQVGFRAVLFTKYEPTSTVQT